MRVYLEQAMEQDHRAGLPLRSALFTSEKSSIPDQWFFDKARQLGYHFTDEMAFHEQQLHDCFKTPDRIPQFVLDFEHSLLMHYSKEEIEKYYGGIEVFRSELEKRLRENQSEGRVATFGINTSFRNRSNKHTEFLAGKMIGVKK
jgi:hypothetical protein